MDVNTRKRAVGGISVPKKGPTPPLQDNPGYKNGGTQFCSRIGCSGKLNYMKTTQVKHLKEVKPSKPFLRSSIRNEVIGSSSKNSSSATNVKRSNLSNFHGSRRKLNSTNESEIQELKASGESQSQTDVKSKSRDSKSNKVALAPACKMVEVAPSNTRIKKVYREKSVRTRRSVNVETSSTGSTVNGGSTSTNTSSSLVPVTSTDHSIAHFMNRGTRQYNMDGIADVLLALERIEQDEELTYEQLLPLEANLFLGGLNFYDQHRDMRLDIDNMSYEELLALEEKMGTVSTGLSEEELPKFLRISINEPLKRDVDDTKCSICQEEFIGGDEIGKMECGHGYHVVCIYQWLRLKKWCPICKASPQPSQSP